MLLNVNTLHTPDPEERKNFIHQYLFPFTGVLVVFVFHIVSLAPIFIWPWNIISTLSLLILVILLGFKSGARYGHLIAEGHDKNIENLTDRVDELYGVRIIEEVAERVVLRKHLPVTYYGPDKKLTFDVKKNGDIIIEAQNQLF